MMDIDWSPFPEKLISKTVVNRTPRNNDQSWWQWRQEQQYETNHDCSVDYSFGDGAFNFSGKGDLCSKMLISAYQIKWAQRDVFFSAQYTIFLRIKNIEVAIFCDLY